MKEEYKQVILVRKDLKMSTGKTAAQCAHASTETIFKSSQPKIKEWRSQGMKKVILKVDSEEKLLALAYKASEAKLENYILTDLGKTFFKEPTITCLAIGPNYSEKIDKITGHLPLL